MHFLKLIVLLLILNFCMNFCNQLKQESKKVDFGKNESTLSFQKIIIKTFKNGNDIKGWGYDIFLNGSLFIHQPHIPAVYGIKGFISEQQAIEVANFVIFKIKNKILPPTININDLDSMQISH